MAFLTLMVLLGAVAALDKLFSAGSTSHMIRRTKTLVSRWGGLVIVLVAGLLWVTVPAISDWMDNKKADDPTGPAWMDWSVFQTLLLSGIRSVALYCFAVLLVRIYMPPVSRFWKKHFVRAFYRLTEWQKIIVSFWAVSLFVFICVSLTH